MSWWWGVAALAATLAAGLYLAAVLGTVVHWEDGEDE